MRSTDPILGLDGVDDDAIERARRRRP